MPAGPPQDGIERRVDHPEELVLAVRQIRKFTATGAIMVEEYLNGETWTLLLRAAVASPLLAAIQHCADGRYRFPRRLELAPGLLPPDFAVAAALDTAAAVGGVEDLLQVDVCIHDGEPNVLALLSPPRAEHLALAMASFEHMAPTIASRQPRRAAVMEWFNVKAGRVVEVGGIDAARAFPGVDVETALRPGDALAHCVDIPGSKRTGKVTATASTLSEARDLLERALQTVDIQTAATF